MENNLAYHDNQKNIMTTKDWFITLLITSIPLIGFIMLIIWALGDDYNLTRKNFAKASLLWMIVISILVSLLYFTIFAAAVATIGSTYI